jgi:hypothetical protein
MWVSGEAPSDVRKVGLTILHICLKAGRVRVTSQSKQSKANLEASAIFQLRNRYRSSCVSCVKG